MIALYPRGGGRIGSRTAGAKRSSRISIQRNININIIIGGPRNCGGATGSVTASGGGGINRAGIGRSIQNARWHWGRSGGRDRGWGSGRRRCGHRCPATTIRSAITTVGIKMTTFPRPSVVTIRVTMGLSRRTGRTKIIGGTSASCIRHGMGKN